MVKKVFDMSRPPRFFISPDQIDGPSITIAGEDVRHIGAVLRMKPGDMLSLSDGAGTEYTVRVVDSGHAEIRTDIVNQTKRSVAYPRMTLGQGLPKADKMDWIVQKATELGASSIVPLVTERTIVKLRDEDKRVNRWQKICREAAMQSYRIDIPRIETVRSLDDFLRTQRSEPRTLLLLPWEEGTTPIKDVLRTHAGMRDIVVLIGPEGGFSPAEADSARSRGFHPVSLGPNILRTETAAVAALSMILYENTARISRH